MASSIKNQLRIKSVKLKNKNAKYKLNYRTDINRTNINGDLTYTISQTTNLAYKGS